ncbi:MAG: hypothetical protein DRO18_02010 [Thermoprotei archaeon]|nr:MAG: hypothetical protein DRO18_02010 [Thermoprotei archaeon]
MLFKLIIAIYNSLFLCEDKPYKHGGVLTYALWLITYILLIARITLNQSLLPVMGLIVISLVTVGLRVFTYSLIISLIPSTWLSLTSLLFVRGDPLINSLTVFTKTLLISLSIIIFINLVHPAEISFIVNNLCRFLGNDFKALKLYPRLLFTLTPSMVRDGTMTYGICRSKGEKVWKSLAILVLHSRERSRAVTEGLWSKLGSIKGIQWFNYDLKYVALFTCLTIINITYYLYVINLLL